VELNTSLDFERGGDISANCRNYTAICTAGWWTNWQQTDGPWRSVGPSSTLVDGWAGVQGGPSSRTRHGGAAETPWMPEAFAEQELATSRQLEFLRADAEAQNRYSLRSRIAMLRSCGRPSGSILRAFSANERLCSNAFETD